MDGCINYAVSASQGHPLISSFDQRASLSRFSLVVAVGWATYLCKDQTLRSFFFIDIFLVGS